MVTRLISAGVGIVIAFVILFLHNTIVLNIAVALISVIMLYELFNAGRCSKLRLSCILGMIYAAVNPFTITGRLAKYHFFISFIILMALFFSFVIQHKTMKYYRLMYITASTILISSSMGCLIRLHEMDNVNGLAYLVMGLCGAWLADSGAYFAGTFFGKKKLCPEVSPKKTVEGFIGGIITNGIIFVLLNMAYAKLLPTLTDNAVTVNYIAVAVLGMALAVVGTLGDLSASVLKRQCGIKDYGNIMPGHGGLMDRFDSVTFVAPFLYAFLTVFNIYH